MPEKGDRKKVFSNQSRLDFTVFEDSKGDRQTTIDFCCKPLGKTRDNPGRDSKT
jgi:hypothetical protein